MPAVEQTSHQRQLGINFNRILSYRWHVQTALKVQERPVSLEHYGCNGYRTLPPLPTVSAEYGVQCHRLWTRPHNNGKDKSVKAKYSAEWGNENHVKSQQARNALTISKSVYLPRKYASLMRFRCSSLLCSSLLWISAATPARRKKCLIINVTAYKN